jgi:hypothetical protein
LVCAGVVFLAMNLYLRGICQIMERRRGRGAPQLATSAPL